MSTTTIPKDVSPPAFDVQNDKDFDLEFTEPGTIKHTDHHSHFRPPLPPNGSVVAHKRTHKPHKDEQGKVRIDFTFETKRGITAHTILIGN